MGKILITARSVAANKAAAMFLESAGHEVLNCAGSRPLREEEMLHLIGGANAAIIGLDSVTAKVLSAGIPGLKVVARNGVGYSNVDVKMATKLGIAVTLTPGANTISVAELAMGLMLSLARHIPQQDVDVRGGAWTRRAMGSELHSKVLGVIGTGQIGAEVIQRAHAFGMKTVAFDVKPRSELCQRYNISYLSLEEVFHLADFLTLHVPYTQKTNGLVNSQKLSWMKASACIINTARGELINENDLHTALKNGLLKGFGADTLIQEPPPASHPLLSLPNVVLTPHCGAYTSEAVSRASMIAAQEVVRVLSGEAPLYSVSETAAKQG